jgi:hypothetical protein
VKSEARTVFYNFQKANGNVILRPSIFGLIDHRGMVKKGGTAKDLFTGFGLMKSSRANGRRPSTAGLGVRDQSVNNSCGQGNFGEAIKV